MRRRISIRGCPSVGPSVRPSVGPSRVIFEGGKCASCAVYPTLFSHCRSLPLLTVILFLYSLLFFFLFLPFLIYSLLTFSHLFHSCSSSHPPSVRSQPLILFTYIFYSSNSSSFHGHFHFVLIFLPFSPLFPPIPLLFSLLFHCPSPSHSHALLPFIPMLFSLSFPCSSPSHSLALLPLIPLLFSLQFHCPSHSHSLALFPLIPLLFSLSFPCSSPSHSLALLPLMSLALLPPSPLLFSLSCPCSSPSHALALLPLIPLLFSFFPHFFCWFFPPLLILISPSHFHYFVTLGLALTFSLGICLL